MIIQQEFQTPIDLIIDLTNIKTFVSLARRPPPSLGDWPVMHAHGLDHSRFNPLVCSIQGPQPVFVANISPGYLTFGLTIMLKIIPA